MIGQNISFETPFGLRIDVTIEKFQEDKPLIYIYTYSMNNLKFKEWLEAMVYLTEGPLAFTAKGIQMMISGGAKKWDKTAFSIDDDDGEKIFLNLLNEEVILHIHRDLFKGKEWEILLNNGEEENHHQTNALEGPEEEDVPF